MRKKVIAGLLAGALAVSMLGCGSKQAEETPAAEETTEAEETAAETEAEPVTLNIFAAASMTETLTEIQEMYKETAPNVTLVFNFDSSGTLKTQIQEGADCDIFISAAQKQMNQLDKDADPEVNTEGLDFVLEGTRVNLLENKVVLAVPDGNPKDIQNFEDLGTDKLSLLALGNEDVPVGQYSTEILTNLGILDKLEADGKITYGSNVKEVTTQVSEASADTGIIYATDAYSAGLTVLNISENQEAAKEFLAYLQTDDCMKVFEAVGFTAAE